MMSFLSNTFSHSSSSRDERLEALRKARKTESDRRLGITRLLALSPEEIHRHTNGPSPIHHSKAPYELLEAFSGRSGFEAFLQEAREGYGFVGTRYRLPSHPFEHPSEAGHTVDITGNPKVSNESVGTFAHEIQRHYLPFLARASETEKQKLRARIYMMMERGGIHGHALYYELAGNARMTPIMVGGATNMSTGGNTARQYLNTFFSMFQRETRSPIEIIRVGVHFGDAYRLLLDEMLIHETIIQSRG